MDHQYHAITCSSTLYCTLKHSSQTARQTINLTMYQGLFNTRGSKGSNSCRKYTDGFLCFFFFTLQHLHVEQQSTPIFFLSIDGDTHGTKVIGFKGLLRTQRVETHMSVKSCSHVGIKKMDDIVTVSRQLVWP